MAADDEFTVEESIELELHGVQVLIDVVGGMPEPWVQLRDDLTLLLGQLRRGEAHPEYAEVQLEKIEEVQREWMRDNPLPPDYYQPDQDQNEDLSNS
ncbi:MAG: hypothetical protein K8R36_15340 [Planctomycetales bacterium]|nr:hypothetical protein [Planctomycetales bacterium]